jgi:hypothetical protein
MSKYRTNPDTGEEEFWCPIDKKWMSVEGKKDNSPSFREFMLKKLTRGDMVENINPSCEHFGSTGTIQAIKKLPEIGSKHVKSKHNTPGIVAVYKVDNNGDTFSPGDLLTKTIIQLKKL